MYLAWEAMANLVPDLYVGKCINCPVDAIFHFNEPFLDSMGYAFTFHVVAQLARIPIGAYVHYPTISVDMLARVKSRKSWHTNAGAISSSVVLSNLKLV